MTRWNDRSAPRSSWSALTRHVNRDARRVLVDMADRVLPNLSACPRRVVHFGLMSERGITLAETGGAADRVDGFAGSRAG